MEYTKRNIESHLKQTVSGFSIVALTGPRQSGKSTLLKHILSDYQYVSFDDPLMVSQFEEDPRGFVNLYNDRVIFDEAQYVPDLFRYIKIAVDNDRQKKGKFVLTGSSQFSFINKIQESLAGRVGLLSLLPFQFNEMPPNEKTKAQYQGSYPELVLDHYHFAYDWYSAYFDTYLNKDISAVMQIGDRRDFRRLVKLLAARAAEQLNLSSLAKEVGVSVPTIKRWVSVLEACYVVFLLPPFYENYGKRIVKAPKLYFYDNGLLAYLLGVKDPELLKSGPLTGNIFENYIVSEIKKRELHQVTHNEIYYLRTSSGEEVDVIIDQGQTKQWIEIKHSSTPKNSMVKPMQNFIGENDSGYLVYNGEAFKFTPQINAINYKDYLA